MDLVAKVVGLHKSLDQGGVAHAFGGALALAWCTQRARATIDIDVNLFTESGLADQALSSLPPGVAVTKQNRSEIERDGQTRLWWDKTPVDVFFNTTPFHDEVNSRARIESFGGTAVPFLSCVDIAVFKTFFNRTKDWADLEEMSAAGTLDKQAVMGVLADYLGGADERIERIRLLP